MLSIGCLEMVQCQLALVSPEQGPYVTGKHLQRAKLDDGSVTGASNLGEKGHSVRLIIQNKLLITVLRKYLLRKYLLSVSERGFKQWKNTSVSISYKARIFLLCLCTTPPPPSSVLTPSVNPTVFSSFYFKLY